MLRTEHISRSTKKEKFLPLLGYEVCFLTLNELPPSSSLKHVFLDDAEFSSMHVKKSVVSCRCVSLLCYPQSGFQLEDVSMMSMVLTNHHGHGQIYRIGLSHFRGYLLFIQAYSQLDYAYG